MQGRLIILVAFLIASCSKVFAAPPVIISFPERVEVEKEFIIQATMSGLTKNSSYRLRIAFSDPGGRSYFGSTEGSDGYYNGSPSPVDYTKYKTITTDEKGNWTGEIKGKVENNDPHYNDKTEKQFELKLGRYTSSGSSATWSEAVKVNIENLQPVAPTLSPTKKAETVPKKTVLPTQIQVGITVTQPSPIQTITINETEENQIPETNNILSSKSSSLDITSKETPLIESIAINHGYSKAKYFFLIFGVFLILLSLLPFLRVRKIIN